MRSLCPWLQLWGQAPSPPFEKDDSWVFSLADPGTWEPLNNLSIGYSPVGPCRPGDGRVPWQQLQKLGHQTHVKLSPWEKHRDREWGWHSGARQRQGQERMRNSAHREGRSPEFKKENVIQWLELGRGNVQRWPPPICRPCGHPSRPPNVSPSRRASHTQAGLPSISWALGVGRARVWKSFEFLLTLLWSLGLRRSAGWFFQLDVQVPDVGLNRSKPFAPQWEAPGYEFPPARGSPRLGWGSLQTVAQPLLPLPSGPSLICPTWRVVQPVFMFFSGGSCSVCSCRFAVCGKRWVQDPHGADRPLQCRFPSLPGGKVREAADHGPTALCSILPLLSGSQGRCLGRLPCSSWAVSLGMRGSGKHLCFPSFQSLSHCELITDDGILHLSNSPCGHERLRVLELDNCLLITDVALEHLENCRGLERLELYDCQQVTRAGIKRMRVSVGQQPHLAVSQPTTNTPRINIHFLHSVLGQ